MDVLVLAISRLTAAVAVVEYSCAFNPLRCGAYADAIAFIGAELLKSLLESFGRTVCFKGTEGIAELDA